MSLPWVDIDVHDGVTIAVVQPEPVQPGQLAQTGACGCAVGRDEAGRGTVCIGAPVVQAGPAIAELSLCVPTYGVWHVVLDRTPGYGGFVAGAAAVTRPLSAHCRGVASL